MASLVVAIVAFHVLGRYAYIRQQSGKPLTISTKVSTEGTRNHTQSHRVIASLPFFKIVPKSLDLKALGAGCKIRLESRMKRLNHNSLITDFSVPYT